MRIAFFTDAYYPRINGVAISVHSYAVELVAHGHTVCIVAPSYPEENDFVHDQSPEFRPDIPAGLSIVRISSLKNIVSREDRMAKLDKWFFIKSKMDSFAPDIIHLNSEFFVGYYGMLYARHRKKPCVYTFHTMWQDYGTNYLPFLTETAAKTISRQLVSFYLRHAKLIIAPTERIAQYIAELGIKLPARLLPTGIPERLFDVVPEVLESVRKNMFTCFPSLAGKRILMFAGRVVKEKNLDFLLDVLELVRAIVPNTALLLVGDGPYADCFAQNAAERHLSDAVFMTGYLPRKELVYYYRFADVFVFPSKTETQGLVTAEAMLASLPVVAIGILGTVDVMQGDNGGFMVGDDVGEFADAVIRLLTDNTLREAKRKEAAEWGKRWTIAALTDKLESYYQQCLT